MKKNFYRPGARAGLDRVILSGIIGITIAGSMQENFRTLLWSVGFNFSRPFAEGHFLRLESKLFAESFDSIYKRSPMENIFYLLNPWWEGRAYDSGQKEPI